MKRSDVRRWAMLGAQQRLAEIVNEQGAILAAFPKLRTRGTRGGATSVNNGESQPPQRKRRRFRMSAEARKRISEAQKARSRGHYTPRRASSRACSPASGSDTLRSSF
jgi:hypothetical protein